MANYLSQNSIPKYNLKVSVIIPTYNRSVFLLRAIESVINQTYSDLEIIVVDDNGIGLIQKETQQLVSQFPSVKLVAYTKNKGACHARNEGARMATGDILMFLDDDDYFLPHKVERQLEQLLNDKNTDACLCAMKRVDQAGIEIETSDNFPRGYDLKNYILNGNCFTSMIAIKKEVFDEIGGFDEIQRFQDKLFIYKFFKENKKMKILDEQLIVFVDHNRDRTSIQSYKKVELAYKKLHHFEKINRAIFSKQEFDIVINRYFLNLSKIRTNASFLERMKGIMFLIKSKTLIKNYKLFIRLLIKDKLYSLIKKLF
jgi:glycosyltransferase involved in cell wall biosynthesis